MHLYGRRTIVSGLPRRALAPLAERHRLGALVSVHRQYRPFVRRRALFIWAMTGTCLILIVSFWAAQVATGQDRDNANLITTFIFIVELAGAPLVGPITARIHTPGPRARWIARYENGLIDARRPTDQELDREPEFNVIAKVIGFDQIRDVVHVRQHTARKRPPSTPSVRRILRFDFTVSGTGRIVADRDGETTVLDLIGFHRQDALLDAVEEATGPRIFERAEAEFRQTGRVTFGDLTVTGSGLSARPPAVDQPAEALFRHPGMVTAHGLSPLPTEPTTEASPPPAGRSSITIRWERVVDVEVYNGSLVVYRQGRPGEAALFTDGTAAWFDRVVANAWVAHAIITAIRADELQPSSPSGPSGPSTPNRGAPDA
jgi:hypothetical protein